ncbi:MAG TPA: FAD-linked oxidase C-terminal domain-containing protein [Acidimicrobiales bacterium]|jgi:glycolate oxidase|nr:FAD-linked oxidase C-terminal domain-containing protein [Acidimicrobiales bacterium]
MTGDLAPLGPLRRERVVDALQAAVPAGAVVTDPDVMEQYRYDRAMTVQPGSPLAVVRAGSTADVQGVVRVAAEHRVPLVTRGAGTGLSGGASAIDGCITLSTERMRAIEIDRLAMTATVQPGLLNAEVKAAAREAGLWYPPDPSSFEICSIGGNLATNAGGLCCVKYGVTTDYVLGLEVVLADGRAVRLGGSTVKDVAGYDLKRLFVGSEGTLGVITEATLRLRPRVAELTTVAATFASVVDAGRAVTAIVSALRPRALELMDGAAIAAVERVQPMGFGAGVGALLVGQLDGPRSESDAVAEKCRVAGAVDVVISDDEVEGELLMAARRMAIPCVERLGAVLIEDVGVPVDRVPDLVAAVAEVADRHGIDVPVIGHAGDGNFHPLVTFDPSDDDARRRAGQVFDEIMDAALALGGTISGEHGIGSLKARHLGAQLGPDVVDVTRAIKAALDPAGILNPGKWI